LAELILPEERKLDWVSRHDPKSLEYPARSLFNRREPQNITWRTPKVPLDQGREGACVGFGWTHEAMTTPVVVDFAALKVEGPKGPTQFAQNIYREAQKIDEWHGEDYDGTSVLAGAKMMKAFGLLREYRWSFGAEEVALSLTNIGPAVLGIPWHEGMYEAPDGILQVQGEQVGGHCILATAYRKAGFIFDEPAFGLFNSWGPYWGKNGFAWIRHSELAFLLRQQGEACVPTKRSYGR
jgi:hypothetical protein